ncbi:MAG: alpha/beta hydrolase [bacterium]|nr:alpha/beta hydrolase [bacterium]
MSAIVIAILVGLLLLSVGCADRLIYLSPPGAIPGPPLGDDPAPPTHRLLLIHGFGAYPAQLSRLWLAAVHLLPENCEVYLVPGLDPKMGVFEKSGPAKNVQLLEQFLQSQEIPLANLHIVSHSMGGLVARAFAAEHPGAVNQVFLIGTPNGGVKMLNGLHLEGWCTPEGIVQFNTRYPPAPEVLWYIIAGARYRQPLTGAFWEGVPNDGLVGTESVLSFRELCGDSIFCETQTVPFTHPDLNWGENLLDSQRCIRWVLERVLMDLRGDIDSPAATGSE